MEDIISVIIPVYNVEKYLMRCMKTVCNQTYKNLEIILVDDGSTDKSGAICDELMQKDSRITVIHKQNGGLSNARNVGISYATGEWIAFVDSDDWISLEMFEKLHSLACLYKADIAVGGFREVRNPGQRIEPLKNRIRILDSNIEAVNELIIDGSQIGTAVWNKLYRKCIFNKVLFEEGRIHEDIFFTPKAFYYCNKVVVTNETMYYYFVSRTDSITKKPLSNRNMDAIDAFKNVADFFGTKLQSRFSMIYMNRYYGMMIWMYCRFREQSQMEICRDLEMQVRNNLKNAINCNRNLGNYKQIFKLLVFVLSPSLYYIFWSRFHV